MKKIFCLAFAVAAVVATALADGEGDEAAAIEREGGIVQKPYKGKYIVIVNNQTRIPSAEFFAKDNRIEDIFNFPVRVVEKGQKVEDAGVIVQVNDSKSAPSLLVAPESAWAGVNVAALATDSPTADVLRTRVQKEVMRAYLYAAGVGNSEVQPCLMRHIKSAKDLDKCSVMQPGPSAVGPVMNTASHLGIFERTFMTYKEACEQGWASAPTNDVQKAIWEKVHAMPTEPIKIKPEEKKTEK